MSSWHDTDHFWEAFQDVMFNRRRWDLADEEADGVIRLTGIEQGAEVLDLCCGPGRHAFALGERGYQVTGVDRTASYIESATTRAGELDANLEFLVGDARVYQNPGRFDAAICLYTSFGYFETEDEDLQLLKNVCVSLKDSGTFVLDMNGKEVLQRTFTDRSSEDLEDGSTFSEERTIGPEWDWMENRWVVTRGGVERETTWRVRLYSGEELRSILLLAGFESVELYGDWTGTPYDDQARRLIAVARK